MFESYNLFRP